MPLFSLAIDAIIDIFATLLRRFHIIHYAIIDYAIIEMLDYYCHYCHYASSHYLILHY
jgi:hypothetical protein